MSAPHIDIWMAIRVPKTVRFDESLT